MKTLTEKQVNAYIKKQWLTKTTQEISDYLGIPRTTLTSRAKRLKLPDKSSIKKVYSLPEQIAEDKNKRQQKEEQNSLKKRYKLLLSENEILSRELEASLQMKQRLSPPVFKYKESGGKNEAVAVVLASDWHIEEAVDPKTVNNLNHFSLQTAEERVSQFFQSALKLVVKEQQAVKIETLVVALLGDFISGNIHEALLPICKLPPMEAIILAENWIAGGIDYLLANSKLKLIIPCHVGNHSRITKKVMIAQETGNSLESFMYHHLAARYEDNPRVSFLIADGYLSYLNLFGFMICFQHGHAVRYQGGVGGLTIPLNKAVAQWEKSPTRASLYCMGHWHSFIDAGNAVVNGSIIGYNAFARFMKLDFEKPKQMFFLIDKKRKAKTVTCPILFNV